MDHHHHSVDDPDDEHAGRSSNTSFSLDDAFSDADDNDASLEFSPAAIREDLAKNGNSADSWHIGQTEAGDFARKSINPDASVSTFDIDAGHEPLSPPAVQHPLSSASSVSGIPSQPSRDGSFYEVQLSSGLSQVALSDGRVSPAPHEAEQRKHHVAEYPAVQIDASDPRPIAAELKTEALLEPGANGEAHRRSMSHDELRAPTPVSPPAQTPQSSASVASTSSHATAASLTSPSSATSNASVASNASKVSNASTVSFHRTARSLGPSALDKVVSKTRPSFLPPKSRVEDQKHMADWEIMMKRSRAAEEKRRKALQERRLERERKIEESIHIWEREIVPDWTVVHRNPALRKLWWGGIPTKLRTTMWQNAAGNSLVLSKDAYKTCLSRAKRALASGSFPTTVLGFLEDDISTTLPALHLFHSETGPLYQDLKDLLCAWVVSRSDEGLGYVHGIAKIAAMILINMPAAQGFVVMRNVLERHCMRSFYGGFATRDDVEAYYRIFDTLLADGMPKIYFNFKQHQISPSSYLPDWLVPLFLDHLPFEACARIWDILLLEGDSFLYRAALAILAVLEPRLFFPDRRELLELLKGENKAALEVAKRDGRPLNGAKYEIYGVDEETLWERLDSMDEWWRASTWTRLIQRELPDL
ncbi:RabGAP/TBC [Amylocystis lapponica]|nr:RabGAP/TBC [Amylocystis lapponica]